jgi:hypothetical protein
MVIFSLAEFFKIVTQDLFPLAVNDADLYTCDVPGAATSFKRICQKFLFTIVELFRLSDKNTQFLYPGALLLGSIVGLLSKK